MRSTSVALPVIFAAASIAPSFSLPLSRPSGASISNTRVHLGLTPSSGSGYAAHSARASESEAINWTDVGEGVGDVAKIATKFIRDPTGGHRKSGIIHAAASSSGHRQHSARATDDSEAINWTDVGEGVGDVAKIATKFIRSDPKPVHFYSGSVHSSGNHKPSPRAEHRPVSSGYHYSSHHGRAVTDSEAINWTDVGEGVGDVAKIATKFIRSVPQTTSHYVPMGSVPSGHSKQSPRADASEAINWSSVGDDALDFLNGASSAFRRAEAEGSEAINWSSVGNDALDFLNGASSAFRRSEREGSEAINWSSVGNDALDFLNGASSAFRRSEPEGSEAINWSSVGNDALDFLNGASSTVRRAEPQGSEAINWSSVGNDALDFLNGASSAFRRAEAEGSEAINWSSVGNDALDFLNGASSAFRRAEVEDSEAISWDSVGNDALDFLNGASSAFRRAEGSEAVDWTKIGEGAGDVAKIASKFIKKSELDELD